MPDDQTIKKLIWSRNNLLNATFQSHPIKMGCCSTNEKSLIVTTINPIWCSRPVHPGTKIFTICSLKSKENISFAVRRHRSNPYGHTDRLVMFVCSGDTSDGQSS